MSPPVILLAVGTAFSAIGTLAAAKNAADVAKFNEKVSKQNATIARQTSAEQEARFRRASRQRMGTLRAGFAGSSLLNGSAFDALADSAAQEELEALSIRYEGELAARGYTSQAKLYDAEQSNAKIRGVFGAASQTLQGAGTALSLRSGVTKTPTPAKTQWV